MSVCGVVPLSQQSLTVPEIMTLFVRSFWRAKPRWGHKSQGLTVLWGKDLEIDTWGKSHVKRGRNWSNASHKRAARLPRITGSSWEPEGGVGWTCVQSFQEELSAGKVTSGLWNREAICIAWICISGVRAGLMLCAPHWVWTDNPALALWILGYRCLWPHLACSFSLDYLVCDILLQ